MISGLRHALWHAIAHIIAISTKRPDVLPEGQSFLNQNMILQMLMHDTAWLYNVEAS